GRVGLAGVPDGDSPARRNDQSGTLPSLHEPSARFPGKPGNRAARAFWALMAILCDIRCSANGLLLEISFVPDSGTSGPGTFSVRTRGPGDAAFSAAFIPKDDTGANLRSDGSGFGFDKAKEGPDRWALAMVKDGDTDVSTWYSADEGQTGKRF
ncbi:MAG: hypothetical protein ACYC96_16290, partial [Fimbriimonadaceae bacterium]